MNRATAEVGLHVYIREVAFRHHVSHDLRKWLPMDELSETLRALADPSRRRQLMRLTQGPATSGQLAELLSMSRPAGSQHLAVLVGAGLVLTTPLGRQRWHEISPDRLYRAQGWLTELLKASEPGPAIP